MVEKVKIHDAKFDSTFRILFGGEDKSRTISFLNAVYDLTGEDSITDVKIEFANNIVPEIKGMGKGVVFDVTCYDKSGKYFIIEMQKASFSGYFERAIYYGSRQLVSAANILWQDNKKQYEQDVDLKGKENSINKNIGHIFYSSLPKINVLSVLDYAYFDDYDDYLSSYEIRRKSDNALGSKILS